ncbi:BlaI/MecI/CopY family transcriptional regulator [Bacillota bacterium Meth-B3]|nr:BlaI/MecI/CopY family transcriptional regulator [Christensenellaceae bacterium]MEA5066917.1 BlaI/MecI/CopY family transcriptional regulator [Eubacteriales bacterium]MEA5067515.1 BlaI/MecI/CopY family transcriptional regulator [Christensenellaceae bacterium]
MDAIRKLPDAEFDVMQVVWASEPPITSAVIMERLGRRKGWKAQTVLTLLTRLVERGFLRTEKHGKERSYFPLIGRADYLKFETGDFMARFHGNSFASLVAALYDGQGLREGDLDELAQWLKERSDR